MFRWIHECSVFFINCGYLLGVVTTTDRREAFGFCEDELQLELPSTDSWIIVNVTCVINPSHFFVVLPFGNKSISDMVTGVRKPVQSSQHDGKLHLNYGQLDAMIHMHCWHADSYRFFWPSLNFFLPILCCWFLFPIPLKLHLWISYLLLMHFVQWSMYLQSWFDIVYTRLLYKCLFV